MVSFGESFCQSDSCGVAQNYEILELADVHVLSGLSAPWHFVLEIVCGFYVLIQTPYSCFLERCV